MVATTKHVVVVVVVVVVRQCDTAVDVSTPWCSFCTVLASVHARIENRRAQLLREGFWTVH